LTDEKLFELTSKGPQTNESSRLVQWVPTPRGFCVEFLSSRVFNELLQRLPVATASCAEKFFRMGVRENISHHVVGRQLELWCIALAKCGHMNFALRHLEGSPDASASTAKATISPEPAARGFVLLPLQTLDVTEVKGTNVQYFVDSMKRQGLYVPRVDNFKGIDFCVMLDGTKGARPEAWCFQVTVAPLHPLPPSVFDEFANAFAARGISMFMVWVGYDASGVTKAQKLGTKPTLNQTRRWNEIPQLSLTLPYAFASYTNAPQRDKKEFRVVLDQTGTLMPGDFALVNVLHLVRDKSPTHL
jgi:hypothetical protein